MDRIFLAVRAKINLSLDVVGVREDKYHMLDMCLASIDIADKLDCSLADNIVVTMDGNVCGAENIAYRAASECVTLGLIAGLKVNITKGIPISSGMGGSSADCAGVLFAIQKLTGCDQKPLLKIAEKLASDAVFMYHGGIARAMGKGDDLQFLPYKKIYFLVAKNRGGALTKDVFDAFDSGVFEATDFTQNCIKSLQDKTVLIGNALTNAAISVDGGIQETLNALSQVSKKVCMTGSGSACFAIFDTQEEAEKALNIVKNKVNFAKVACTCPCGIEIISLK